MRTRANVAALSARHWRPLTRTCHGAMPTNMGICMPAGARTNVVGLRAARWWLAEVEAAQGLERRDPCVTHATALTGAANRRTASGLGANRQRAPRSLDPDACRPTGVSHC